MNVELMEELASGYWTDSEKNTYINMAYLHCAGDIRWKQTSTTFTLQTSKVFYLAPSDLLVPLRIRDTTNVGGTTTNLIFPGSLMELETTIPGWRVVGSGTPIKTIFRSTEWIQLWPPPGSSYAGKTVTVEYVPVPTSLVNDTDTFDGPLSASEAVLCLSEVFALLKYDAQKAVTKYNEYVDRVAKSRADFDRDSVMQTLKWRIGQRFEKAHHAVGYRRLWPTYMAYQ